MMPSSRALVFLVAGLTCITSSAADDPEQLFKQCQICHAVGAGAAHQVGPHLNGLAERPAGAMQG